MASGNLFGYRSAPRTLDSSSENSGSDSEDGVGWKRKKTAETTMDVPFQNPLLQEKKDGNSSNSQKARKKVNNIWGSVLLEQTVTQELSGQAMETFERTRDVESYDYKRFKERISSGSESDDDGEKGNNKSDDDGSKDDDTGKMDQDKEDDISDERDRSSRKRVRDRVGAKNSIKNRIGKKDIKNRLGDEPLVYKSNNKEYFHVKPEDSKEMIVAALSENLKEPKIDLLERVVTTLGNRKAIDLMYETDRIEETGGLQTLDGRRRRTAGGVYFFMIKNDKDISPEMYQTIFQEHDKIEARKMAKARKRRIREQMATYQNKISTQGRTKPKSKMDVDSKENESLNQDNAIEKKDKFSAATDAVVREETMEEEGEIKDVEEINSETKSQPKEELEDGELEDGEIAD